MPEPNKSSPNSENKAQKQTRTEIYHPADFYKKSAFVVGFFGFLFVGTLLASMSLFSYAYQVIRGEKPIDWDIVKYAIQSAGWLIFLPLLIPITGWMAYNSLKDYFSNAPRIKEPAIAFDEKGITTSQISEGVMTYDSIERIIPVTFEIQPNRGKCIFLGFVFKNKEQWEKLAEKNGLNPDAFKWAMESAGVYGEDYYVSIENLEIPADAIIAALSKNPDIAKRLKPMEIRQTYVNGESSVNIASKLRRIRL
ncbi:hypothetical protein HYV43_02340 [Candidatus Micrarchaeota archaeon]|nr:hypothetical protein [Candidatus Micrarchaeota archaeon]